MIKSPDEIALYISELQPALDKAGVKTLSFYDALYPALLKQIYDPPSALFYRGNWIDSDEACVAIVGTRLISSYGRAVLPRIAQPLIDSKITIVSGLAYGVDAAAHTEAVKNKARTIAVLGSGVDDASIYPRQHVRLAQEILENNGLIISEHPPGTPAYKQHFIARNRIIAGMSLGTIVVEGKLKSGALITADYAMDAGRPVYAVPGPVYSPFSEGPHKLIRDGALLIQSGSEVLEDLGLQIAQTSVEQKNFTDLELRVLECMQSEPRTIDELKILTNTSIEILITTLSQLELQNAVRNLGPQGFIKS